MLLQCVQLKMKELLITVGRYPCGSLDVQVSSAGLAIADKRHMPNMPGHLSILSITPDESDLMASSSHNPAPWETAQGFASHNLSMPDFSRLNHRSSFERRHTVKRAQSGVSPLLRHRLSSDDQPGQAGKSGPRHDPFCMQLFALAHQQFSISSLAPEFAARSKDSMHATLAEQAAHASSLHGHFVSCGDSKGHCS